MIRSIFGTKANFCSEGCADSFKCDKEHGLIYPPYKVDGKIMGVYEASIEAEFCAYCNADLGEEPQKTELESEAT